MSSTEKNQKFLLIFKNESKFDVDHVVLLTFNESETELLHEKRIGCVMNDGSTNIIEKEKKNVIKKPKFGSKFKDNKQENSTTIKRSEIVQKYIQDSHWIKVEFDRTICLEEDDGKLCHFSIGERYSISLKLLHELELGTQYCDLWAQIYSK
eukprot:Pgem_evm1s128